MKKLILSFVLSIFTGYITANNFVQQIQQYGDNGDFHRMDSIYSLAKQQVNYQNDPVAAVEIHTTYATYLNSKREYDKAYSILKDVKKEISLLKDRRFSSDAQKKLLQSESIATYEIAYGLWSNNKLDEAKKFAHEAIKLFEQANDTSRLAESYNLSGVIYKNSFMLDKAILMYLKSATKLFSVLLASKRPLITELADKLRLKYPLLPTISPCPTMRLEAIRSIIPISCRRYPKSV